MHLNFFFSCHRKAATVLEQFVFISLRLCAWPKTTVPPLLCLLDCFLFELHSVLSDATTPMCVGPYLRNHPPSVLSPRLPYPVNSWAHNCTSHVVSPSGIFRSVNVLAMQSSWGEEIKKLNKRVELKHTSLTLTKTQCYSLGLFWRALHPKNRFLFILRGKTENH